MSFRGLRSRRWLRYRLRTLLILFTVFCVWLGAVADRAHKQRQSVAALRAARCLIAYDNEPEPNRWKFLDRFNWPPMPDPEQGEYPFGLGMKPVPPDPPTTRQQLQNWVGPDYFVSVTAVSVSVFDVNDDLVAHLKNLPKLKKVFVHLIVKGDPQPDLLRAALPGVEIIY